MELERLESPLRAVNGGCAKCGRTLNTERHHIKMRVDGGGDEAANIALLCVLCHGEWHSVSLPPTSITFEEWIDAPTIRQFLKVFFSGDYDDRTVGETLEAMQEARSILFKATSPEDVERLSNRG